MGMDVVEAIELRQKAHPPLAGLPRAAAIHGLPLFIGEADAATVRACHCVSFCILVAMTT